MTALCNVLAFNGPMPVHYGRRPIASKMPALLKNMALFLASPFIGLAYAVLLPFVGLGMLLWVATEGWRKSRTAVAAAPCEETVVAEAPVVAAVCVEAAEEPRAHGLAAAAMLVLKLLAAPFAGLAFVVLLPFVALGALAWTALRAAG